jgi:hypothetical protein
MKLPGTPAESGLVATLMSACRLTESVRALSNHAAISREALFTSIALRYLTIPRTANALIVATTTNVMRISITVNPFSSLPRVKRIIIQFVISFLLPRYSIRAKLRRERSTS